MTVVARYLALFSNPSCRENHGLGGRLISDGKFLQGTLEKLLVTVLLSRFSSSSSLSSGSSSS